MSFDKAALAAYLGNRTLHGIHNDAVRYSWAGYHIFIILSSLLGDTTILIASIKYKAFKLQKVIVIILQHIAVADLLTTIFAVFPKGVSIIANKWVFGDFLCHFLTYAGYYSAAQGFYLIAALTSTKLYILLYPLKESTLTTKSAHIGCGIIWAFVLILPITMFAVDRNDILFEYMTYDCNYVFTSPVWNQGLKMFLTVLLDLIPSLVVVITNGYLIVLACKIAKNGRESLKWQGLTTTIATAIIYTIANLPVVFFFQTGAFHMLTLLRVLLSCTYLNIISNFYIYCLTITSFREFLLSKMLPSSRRNAGAQRMQVPRAQGMQVPRAQGKQVPRRNIARNVGIEKTAV